MLSIIITKSLTSINLPPSTNTLPSTNSPAIELDNEMNCFNNLERKLILGYSNELNIINKINTLRKSYILVNRQLVKIFTLKEA
ncbi:hypothetical protein ABK040_011764 [Willaertia magna]